MAKMFYTLDEAAQQLGMQTDQVKQMASDGRLQQFRDRDKLMFKRDQIESMAGGGEANEGGDASGETSVGQDTGVPRDDSASNDAIDLKAETQPGQGVSQEDTREATGVSVFDTNEVNQADPSAQTQVNQQQDEELALESVGSGSGLLDLTRESDDTSLGAELLDEIYPSSGEESDQQQASGSVAGSSGVFEGSEAGDTAAGQQSAMGDLGEPSPAEPTASQPTQETTTALAAEPYDPAGSGLGTGLFIGAAITLILGFIVMIPAIAGVNSSLVDLMTAGDNSIVIWAIGLLVGSAILGVIGLFIGKSVGGS